MQIGREFSDCDAPLHRKIKKTAKKNEIEEKSLKP